MTATSHLRGHPIYWSEDDQEWRYVDTDEPTESTWRGRPCGHCGEHETPEGHDPCLGTLPGVRNACCGHGDPGEAYIEFEGGLIVRGFRVVTRTPSAGGVLKDLHELHHNWGSPKDLWGCSRYWLRNNSRSRDEDWWTTNQHSEG